MDIISKIMVHVFIKTPLRIDLLRAKKAKSFKNICNGIPFTVELQAVGAILLKNKFPHIYFASSLVRFSKQRFLEIHLVGCFFYMKKNRIYMQAETFTYQPWLIESQIVTLLIPLIVQSAASKRFKLSL